MSESTAEMHVDQEYSLKREFEEKVFARCIQILDEKGEDENYKSSDSKIIKIPFTAYDAIEDRILNGDYFEECPFFVDDELKNKVVLMRILEEITSSELTELTDINGAIINPMLCKGKSISTEEDHSNEVVNVVLTTL